MIGICGKCKNKENMVVETDSTSLLPPPYVIQRPELLFKPKILTPPKVSIDRDSVLIIIQVLVDTTGIVENAQIIKSDDKRLNKYALKYAYKYKFKPGKVNNKNTKLAIAIQITFYRRGKY
jgi:TonB family protein